MFYFESSSTISIQTIHHFCIRNVIYHFVSGLHRLCEQLFHLHEGYVKAKDTMTTVLYIDPRPIAYQTGIVPHFIS